MSCWDSSLSHYLEQDLAGSNEDLAACRIPVPGHTHATCMCEEGQALKVVISLPHSVCLLSYRTSTILITLALPAGRMRRQR